MFHQHRKQKAGAYYVKVEFYLSRIECFSRFYLHNWFRRPHKLGTDRKLFWSGILMCKNKKRRIDSLVSIYQLIKKIDIFRSIDIGKRTLGRQSLGSGDLKYIKLLLYRQYL